MGRHGSYLSVELWPSGSVRPKTMPMDNNNQISERKQPEMPAANEPEPTKALNVIVPASVHKSARVAAAQSGLSLKEFIIRVLKDIGPITVGDKS